ncbi:MAG TPA: 16S rRNA (guanine(527)-N(7))-methyltransferase RsmG [Pilimelia sp.]|nr:16S rRNA (guanine(527)-N(7))-methyltransferase RsmG [Pilimelia sp.]
MDAGPPAHLVGPARQVFGDRLDLAVRYAELLATDGVIRGLIGPREAPRLWERHLLNCAAVAELIPIEASVVDVGSGAGLPGIVLAVARPDLSITLVEPLARRVTFLVDAVAALDLASAVTIVRARAEEYVEGTYAGDPPTDRASRAAERPAGTAAGADIVTARAVAPLDRLARWCLPLTAVGGRLLALKGASAAEEIAAHQDVIRRLGGATPVVRLCGVGVVDPPATVVEIVREREVRSPRSTPSRSTQSRVPARPGRASTSRSRSGSGGGSGTGRGSGRGSARRS